MFTDFDKRMKQYELPFKAVLPRRTYTIIRVDGKAFHTYLRGAEKPFDAMFANAMNETARGLCAEISGSKFAYTQSDEISILVTDFDNLNTEPWFGGEVQKICSVAASCATAHLIKARGIDRLPMFDARVFTLSDPIEVANYFIWRQRDAERNSITMAAQSMFSHKELNGVKTNEMQEMMFQKGINWNDYEDGFKRGRIIVKEFYPVLNPTNTIMNEMRSRWAAQAPPHFTITKFGGAELTSEFLENVIPRFDQLVEFL